MEKDKDERAAGGAAELPEDGAPSEQALRESHRLLLALVDNSPSVMFVKDLQGRYLLVNRRYTEVVRKRADEVLGVSDDVLYPEEIVREVRARDELVSTSGQQIEFEERVPSWDGEERTYLTVKFPLFAHDGAVIGTCGIATDITEMKRAEAAQLELQQQVIEAQRAALRELSTPLVPIADGVLAMPLVGTIDSIRAREIMESLLQGIAGQRAHTAILDITGVRVVDTQVADALVSAARAARLLGAEVVLTGISAAVAQTLVSLETNLGDIVTLGTLQSGIAYALRAERGQ
jgi:rsbT co-antagonist protein RsbR